MNYNVLFFSFQVLPPEFNDPTKELGQLAQSKLSSFLESGDSQAAVQLTAAILSTLTSEAMQTTSKEDKKKVLGKCT